MNHRLIACVLGLLLVVVGVVCIERPDVPRSLGPSRAEAAPPITGTPAPLDTPDPAVFATGGKVEVEIVPVGLGVLFTNNIYLFSTSPPRFIGTNRDGGTVVNLGTFPDGTELVFGIGTPENHSYVTGPGERNPDGIAHAIVEAAGPGTVTVRFEDLFAGGDLNFADAVIRVTGAAAP